MELKTTSDFMHSVATRLSKAGFTMRDLSEKLGVTDATLSRAKKGKSNLTFEKANEIEKAVRELCGDSE